MLQMRNHTAIFTCGKKTLPEEGLLASSARELLFIMGDPSKG
jgi:hypothetical protein